MARHSSSSRRATRSEPPPVTDAAASPLLPGVPPAPRPASRPLNAVGEPSPGSEALRGCRLAGVIVRGVAAGVTTMRARARELGEARPGVVVAPCAADRGPGDARAPSGVHVLGSLPVPFGPVGVTAAVVAALFSDCSKLAAESSSGGPAPLSGERGVSRPGLLASPALIVSPGAREPVAPGSGELPDAAADGRAAGATAALGCFPPPPRPQGSRNEEPLKAAGRKTPVRDPGCERAPLCSLAEAAFAVVAGLPASGSMASGGSAGACWMATGRAASPSRRPEQSRPSAELALGSPRRSRPVVARPLAPLPTRVATAKACQWQLPQRMPPSCAARLGAASLRRWCAPSARN